MTASANHFVFIESNTTGTGRLAVERLLAQGERVTFMTRQPGKYPFLERSPDRSIPPLRVLEIETNDPAAVTACVEDLKRQEPAPTALVTFSTFYVVTVAEVAARCGFRFLDPRAARDCHDKYRSRVVLRHAGLPTPEFWLANTEQELEQLSQVVPYPCVIKPTAESGSNGVRLVRDRAQLLAHGRALQGRRVNERDQPLAGHVLLESVLGGPEFSVETLTLGPGRTEIVGVTAKHLSSPPHFVEMGHDFPAALEPHDLRAIEQATLAALEAVGFDWGPAHTELRLTPGGPVVVEINPRLAGGMIPELVRYATGIDLLSAVIALLSDQEVILQPVRHEVGAIRFLTAPHPGRISYIEGVEAAKQLPSIREIRVDKAIGNQVRVAENAIDRLGFIISSNRRRADAIADAERARAIIDIGIEEARD